MSMTNSGSVMDFLADEEYDDAEGGTPELMPAVADSAPELTTTAVEEPAEYDTIGADGTTAVDLVPDTFRSGKRQNPNAPKYGRTFFTDRDKLGLWFLWKFPLASSKQLGIVWGIKRASAHKRALALKELGLVGSEKIMGMTQLWFLTKRGQDLLTFHGVIDERVSRLYKLGSVRLFNLEHRLAVTQVAAQLVGGVSGIQKTSQVPIPTGLDLLPRLIPEQYMNTAYGAMASRYDKGEKKNVIDPDQAWRDQERIAQEVESGRLPISEALARNPGQWTLTTDYTSRKYSNQNHPVDLAIDLEDHRTDLKQPVSIAIEVELSLKNSEDLLRVVTTMARQRERGAVPVFAGFVYVSHKKAVFEALQVAVKRIGAQRLFASMQLRDAEGKLYSGEGWRF
ncbi:hypothetical protein [Microbacterium sp. SORGH_AS_0421]|uniref:hypothetical protein n=1 Tax=Microbacterium sp. SORGH_AS_0421 TaxID=3041768 RepID=UPI002792DC5C|nr:hypothetical protein [Microbacterium sp. SORGH_AS_0421]MDQ1175396.1 hypothetical protein [Microbacterium sp. SORGH_AS_0421]